MMYPVAILAGGLATRLRPITQSIPKAMVLVNGIPFIDYQLTYLKQQGISKVVLCLGYLGHMIEEYVSDGKRYGLNVAYSYDGEQYLGTAGALIKALNFLDENFFILYGDTFLPIDFKYVQNEFLTKKHVATMTIYKNKNHGDISNVRLLSHNMVEYNKKNPTMDMNYIDYGLSMVSSNIFCNLPKNINIDLADVFFELSQKKLLMGVEVFKPFYEIGTFTGLEATSLFLSENQGRV